MAAFSGGAWCDWRLLFVVRGRGLAGAAEISDRRGVCRAEGNWVCRSVKRLFSGVQQFAAGVRGDRRSVCSRAGDRQPAGEISGDVVAAAAAGIAAAAGSTFRPRPREPAGGISGAFVQWFGDPRAPGRSPARLADPAGDLAGFASRVDPERKPAGPGRAHVAPKPGRPEAFVATPSSHERTQSFVVGRYGPVSTAPLGPLLSPSSAKGMALKYQRPSVGGVQKVSRLAMSSSSSTRMALPTAGVTAPASLAK